MVLVQKELKNAYIGEYEYDYEPNANTLLYLPFTEDTQNKASSWITTTNSWVTITTFGWVDCASFNWSSTYLSTSSFSIWDNTTIIWVYNNRPESDTDAQYLFKQNNTFYCWFIGYLLSTNKNWTRYWVRTSDWYAAMGCAGWINKWIMYAWVKDGTKYTVYAFDWTTENKNETTNATDTGTWITYIWKPTWSSYYFNWYMSRFIVENKAWSEQEILEYGNSTKSKYWL